jgi:S-DNA-T family DNA segregation ATPase FtsK/SpoIIIE
MFELELAAGVKVSQISALANDMARALGVGAVRVVAPLPGKHTIGIEVPNSEKEKVRIKSLIENAGSRAQRMQIPLFLGKDSSGESLISDLAKMPHLLIAGTTGSGKSVCINSIITGVLLTKRPDEVKMILIDPKMVEMTAFNTIPHLMCPIVTETKMAVQILEWATVKMDERYALLAEAKVKNIEEFNKLSMEEIIQRFNPSDSEEEAKIPKKLPYIVIVIDELADLMMTAAKEIEAYIVRLAQKSRAIGIHIVLATQRPQATVVTGLIKSNMPCRIGFRVAARMDSRIILDQNGAETLLGEGDMLFLKPGTSELVRAQGTYLDDSEIRGIVKHLKDVAEPQFHPELTQIKTLDPSDMVKDELFDDGVRIVLESKRGSVSLLQRRLNIGYARASRMIEMMAASGILGEYKGSQAREVIITLEEYENIRSNMEADAEAGYKDMAADNEPTEPAYINEGQREYMAADNDEDE